VNLAELGRHRDLFAAFRNCDCKQFGLPNLRHFEMILRTKQRFALTASTSLASAELAASNPVA
jgi:hypothetical protein